jgi:repressor of nif and glnA expression
MNETTDKIEKKRLAILSVLKDSALPLGSLAIMERLVPLHYDMSERTVRFHLQAMDSDGLTECIGRQGRIITEKGSLELSRARVFERVGFLASRIDAMSCAMDFDLEKRTGSVVINTSLVSQRELLYSYHHMLGVFSAGFCMGKLLALFLPGERVGDMVVPKNMVGIGTVCSITLNGILLGHGIPVTSRFGGLLEYIDGLPSRFTAIINYDGTTLDPLEIFIKSGMTDHRGVLESGNGQIGASFREIPAFCRSKVLELAELIDEAGLGGLLKLGLPGQALFEIPIAEGRVAAIVKGGLNPVASLEEHGVSVLSRALSTVIAYDRLFPFTEFEERFRDLIKTPDPKKISISNSNGKIAD